MKQSKYTDEYLKTICKDHNCDFAYTQNEQRNGKSRRIIYYTCNQHSKYGLQSLTIEKFISNKKKCQYCNHSKLKEIFAEEVHSISPNINVLEEYTTWNTPVLCQCNICSYKWKGRAAVLLYGGNCPKCARKKANQAESLSIDEVQARISRVFPDVIVIGKYIGIHHDLRCRCTIHDYEWSAHPARLFNGNSGCPKCKKEKMHHKFALSQGEFEEKVTQINPNIRVIGDYYDRDTKIKCACKIHHNSFLTTPRQLLYKGGNVCPLCFQSMGEQRLIRLLQQYGFNVSLQHIFKECVYIKPLRFDAYDPKYSIAYEYQGEQHYQPINFHGYNIEKAKKDFEVNQIRDQIKRDFCNKNNIHLIEIPYWDYENMESILQNKWQELGIVS